MYLNERTQLDLIKTMTKTFIDKNYPYELELFDAFWDVFSSKVNKGLGSFTDSNIISDISFAKGKDVDLITPTVLATVTETIHKISLKDFSSQELEDFISKTAVRFGAKVELTAALVRGLTALCSEIMETKTKTKTIVS